MSNHNKDSIIFFTQNYSKGGLDTFIIELINHWPNNSKITLICNKNHPGIVNLKSKIKQNINFIFYSHYTNRDFNHLISNLNTFFVFKKIIKIIFFFIGPFYQFYKIKKIFMGFNSEKLLVINGGYPGGDACLISLLVWRSLNKKYKPWLNFHNDCRKIRTDFFPKYKEKIIDYLISKSVEGFVSVSKSTSETICSRFNKNNNKIRYIYNGITKVLPIKKICLREEFNLRKDSIIVAMLALYEERKGHKFIIDVMTNINKQLPNVHLIIFGEESMNTLSTYKSEVEKYLNNTKQLTNVHLASFRLDISDIFSQSDLIVVPSQSFESFGYVALEAMSCGIPAVVTNVGGLPELVENNVTGFVVDKNDYILFANRVVELLSQKEKYMDFSLSCVNRYEKNFTSKKMTDDYVSLL